MKKLILGMLAVVTVFSFTACDKKQEEPNKEDVTVPVTDTNTQNTQVELTNEEMYESVVKDYQNALAEYDLENIDADTKIPENLSDTLIMHIARYASEGVSLAHSYYDLDKNGTDELLIGANNGLGAIYTYDKEAKTPVALAFQSTMERGNMAIYDNGVILMEGAGGAALHYYEFGKIGIDGKSYQVLETIQEEYVDGNEAPTYTDSGTGAKLEYQSLDEIMNKYVGNAEVVTFGTEVSQVENAE